MDPLDLDCADFSRYLNGMKLISFTMKGYLALMFVLLATNANAARVSILARYSESADVFVIMDCVSGWWDSSYCLDDGAYRNVWKDRFGMSVADIETFKKYDQVRQRYYKGLGLPKDPPEPYSDGIFAKRSSITEDQISPAFFSSESLDEALAKLQAVVSADDLIFLKDFYSKYKPKYEQLLKESLPFKKKAKDLSQRLANKKYAEFFSKISAYYSVSEDLKYEVLFTWYPPIEKDFAFPLDKFLILQKNPIKHIHWEDEDVVFHEIVHTLSVRQPQIQKEQISKILLDGCPIGDVFPKGQQTKIIEEPMAVAIGQILFLKTFFPERLHWDSKLYNNLWISTFSKNIYPVIEEEFRNKEGFSVKTAKKLAFLCNELVQTSAILNIGKKIESK